MTTRITSISPFRYEPLSEDTRTGETTYTSKVIEGGEVLGLTGDSKYDFTYFTFPLDLHSDHVDHYMVININVPVEPVAFGLLGNRSSSDFIADQNINFDVLSKVDQLRFNRSSISLYNPRDRIAGVSPTVNADEDITRRIGRRTRRLKQSIALFMPHTPIVHNSIHEFEEVKLTNMMLNGVSSVAGFVGAAASRGSVDAAVQRGRDAKEAFDRVTGGSAGTVARSLGLMYPINPRVEILYSNTQLRQFVFEFLLAPRSEKESEAIASIVRSLRFHAAPELTNLGFSFIPPAEFDISFYHKGAENKTLPQLNTCVLERIEADYAPSGVYSTFSNGYPVAVRLSLGFREVEVLHKKRIYQGL